MDIHDWVQKADLQLATDATPNHVALDETVIQIDDHRYWLYATVDPETNRILHIRLFSTSTTALTERFLQELRRSTMSKTPCFLSMASSISRQHSIDTDSDFDTKNTEIGMLSNVSFER
ncbi:transposase [Natrinema thermotolerans DSM 11552]|nr:transposase [Natrinema thermotolerans DSM 11552]